MNPVLIPSLLRIQERYGFVPEHELELLALQSDVPLYRLEELTTFFPHFRRQKPPPVCVHVCDSMSCQLRGAGKLLHDIKELAEKPENEGKLEVHGVSCLGRCDRAPAMIVHHHTGGKPATHEYLYCGANTESVDKCTEIVGQFLQGGSIPQPDRDNIGPPPPWEIDLYRNLDESSRYEAVRQFLAAETNKEIPPADRLTPESILQRLRDGYLVGMGGTGANTYRKWDDVLVQVRKAKGAAYLVANGDESEPGTFKDREIMLHAPHLIIEGMLLAGLMLHREGGGPVEGFLYIRHEYSEQIKACEAALKLARTIVPEAFKRCALTVFTSPGAYICGEESAMIEAIEGRRAQPRNQPPTIKANGLDDKPTLLNNVETFAWVPALALKRTGWSNKKPRRFFSISGDVKKPGVFEVPFTETTLGALIGMAGGVRKPIKSIGLSGPSGGFAPLNLPLPKPLNEFLSDEVLKGLGKRSPHVVEPMRKLRDAEPDRREAKLGELPLDKQVFMQFRLDLGAGIIVYGDGGSLVDQAMHSLRFFERESCGKCVPCRLGCQQLVHLGTDLQRGPIESERKEILETVESLAKAMEVTSICGLGRAASKPLTTLLRYFKNELPVAAEDKP